MPAEGLPLLKGLFKTHKDFTSRFRGGVFFGNILMELLCAVLISLRIDVEIVVVEEALARAHKALQDLKVKKQLVLSSSIVLTIPSEGSLFTGLIS